MTAIVVSFPQERTFRTRPDQIEMRKAYRIARSYYRGSAPSYLWERALCAMRVAAAFKTRVESASAALKEEAEKKERAHENFKVRQATREQVPDEAREGARHASPVSAFPRDRIFRDRQAQIEMRKGYQLIRRNHPTMSPRDAWNGAATGMAIKAGWDRMRERAQEGEVRRTGLSEERLEELARRLAARSLELRELHGLDQPPPSAA